MSRLVNTAFSRRLLAAAVATGLLSAAAPGAVSAAKAGKCDPKIQVCDSGRKNG